MPAPFGITFPATLLNTCISSTFRPVAVNLTSRGMFTGKQLVDGPSYQVWQATLELPALRREQWQEIDSLLARAYDNRTPFKIYDPLRQKPVGAFGNTGSGAGTLWGDDTPWADGTRWADEYFNGMAVAENAPQGRDTILLDGAPASQQRVTVAGDLLTINGFLYQAVNTANADSAGRVRVTIRPRLREGALIGDKVTAGRAYGTFFVMDPGSFVLTRNSFNRRAQTSISFVEALP